MNGQGYIVNSLVDDIVVKMVDNVVNNIVEILKKNVDEGLNISELVLVSKLSRCAVRTELAKLEGAGRVTIRKIGMAKVYILSGGLDGR